MARRELHRRRAAEIETADRKDALTPGEKASITKPSIPDVAADFGFEGRISLPSATLFTGGRAAARRRSCAMWSRRTDPVASGRPVRRRWVPLLEGT